MQRGDDLETTYVLQFENFIGHRSDEATFKAKTIEDAVQKAISLIYKLRRKANYNVFYIRSWPKGDEMVFDFGSHLEFYYLIKKK